jgi:hypothetical protein
MISGARALVEVARRLVGEDDRRTVDQGAGDGDALAFAAGKLRGQVLEARARPTRVSKARAAAVAENAGTPAMRAANATFSSAVSSGISW